MNRQTSQMLGVHAVLTASSKIFASAESIRIEFYLYRNSGSGDGDDDRSPVAVVVIEVFDCISIAESNFFEPALARILVGGAIAHMEAPWFVLVDDASGQQTQNNNSSTPKGIKLGPCNRYFVLLYGMFLNELKAGDPMVMRLWCRLRSPDEFVE